MSQKLLLSSYLSNLSIFISWNHHQHLSYDPKLSTVCLHHSVQRSLNTKVLNIKEGEQYIFQVVSSCPLTGRSRKTSAACRIVRLKTRVARLKASPFFASKGGSTTPRVAHRGCPGWRSSKKLAPPIGLLSTNHSQATLPAMPGLSLSKVFPC